MLIQNMGGETSALAQGTDTETGGVLVKEIYESIKQETEEKAVKKKNKGVIVANRLTEEYGHEQFSEDKIKDGFAGIYLDENQDAVISMTDKADKTVKNIKEVSKTEDIQIRKVEYSLKELKKYEKQIAKVYTKKYKKAKVDFKVLLESIQSYAVNIKDNCIDVKIFQLNEEKENAFQKYISDAACIRLINTEKKNEQVVALKAGQPIYTTKSRYSLGCRVKWVTSYGNTKYGFITSAHGNAVGDNFYANSSLGSSLLGPVVKRKYSGNVDVSVVRLDASGAAYTLSNNLYGIATSSSLSPSIMPQIYTGMAIEKIGSTTGHTSGKVVSVSTTVTCDGKTFSDYIEYTNKSESGDSGGINYAYDPNTSTLKVVGITEASNTITGYGAKFSNIRSSFSSTLSLF